MDSTSDLETIFGVDFAGAICWARDDAGVDCPCGSDRWTLGEQTRRVDQAGLCFAAQWVLQRAVPPHFIETTRARWARVESNGTIGDALSGVNWPLLGKSQSRPRPVF